MSSDCLVLYFEEISKTKSNPNTLFIIYEPSKYSFFICGKRKNNETNQMKEYSFYCKSKKRVSDFIELVLTDVVVMSLYNYSYLPNTCDEIDYNSLNNVRTQEKCIITDNESKLFDRDNLLFFLKVLKNVKTIDDYSL